MTSAIDSLPRYRSHKIVRAAPVLAVGATLGADTDVMLEVAGKPPIMATVPASVFARGEPSPGDYLVFYDDGYVSWSPKKAFEDGYTAV